MDDVFDFNEFPDEVNKFRSVLFSPEAFQRKSSLEEYFEDIHLVDYKFEKEGLILIYPIGEINAGLYQLLSRNQEWKQFYGPQYYFDLLYDFMAEILIHENDIKFPDVIFKKLDALDFKILQKSFLLFGLLWIVDKIIDPIDIKPGVLEKKPKQRPLFSFKLKGVFLYTVRYAEQNACPIPLKPSYNETHTEKQYYLLESKQIAFIYYYNGLQINKQNMVSIAAKYNRVKKTSGLEIYQDYLEICNRYYREGGEDSRRTIKKKIKNINSIIDKLNETGKTKALNDLKMLENNFEKAPKK